MIAKCLTLIRNSERVQIIFQALFAAKIDGCNVNFCQIRWVQLRPLTEFTDDPVSCCSKVHHTPRQLLNINVLKYAFLKTFLITYSMRLISLCKKSV